MSDPLGGRKCRRNSTTLGFAEGRQIWVAQLLVGSVEVVVALRMADEGKDCLSHFVYICLCYYGNLKVLRTVVVCKIILYGGVLSAVGGVDKSLSSCCLERRTEDDESRNGLKRERDR